MTMRKMIPFSLLAGISLTTNALDSDRFSGKNLEELWEMRKKTISSEDMEKWKNGRDRFFEKAKKHHKTYFYCQLGKNWLTGWFVGNEQDCSDAELYRIEAEEALVSGAHVAKQLRESNGELQEIEEHIGGRLCEEFNGISLDEQEKIVIERAMIAKRNFSVALTACGAYESGAWSGIIFRGKCADVEKYEHELGRYQLMLHHIRQHK
jgi:hypothetical protein